MGDSLRNLLDIYGTGITVSCGKPGYPAFKILEDYGKFCYVYYKDGRCIWVETDVPTCNNYFCTEGL